MSLYLTSLLVVGYEVGSAIVEELSVQEEIGGTMRQGATILVERAPCDIVGEDGNILWDKKT